jgi:hypothetical protein
VADGAVVRVQSGNQMGIHLDHLTLTESARLQEFLHSIVSEQFFFHLARRLSLSLLQSAGLLLFSAPLTLILLIFLPCWDSTHFALKCAPP